MSEEIEDQDDDNVPEVIPDGNLSFLIDQKSDPHYKLQKALDPKIKDALAFLSSVLADDKADPKLKFQCAKEILDKKLAVSESIKKDQLSRLVATARNNMMLQQKANFKNIKRDDGDDDDENESPKVMFIKDKIVDVSNIDNL